MDTSDLLPDRFTTTVDLWFVKFQAEWAKKSGAEKIEELRKQKAVASRKIREAKTGAEKKKWKARLKKADDELQYQIEKEARRE